MTYEQWESSVNKWEEIVDNIQRDIVKRERGLNYMVKYWKRCGFCHANKTNLILYQDCGICPLFNTEVYFDGVGVSVCQNNKNNIAILALLLANACKFKAALKYSKIVLTAIWAAMPEVDR